MEPNSATLKHQQSYQEQVARLGRRLTPYVRPKFGAEFYTKIITPLIDGLTSISKYLKPKIGSGCV